MAALSGRPTAALAARQEALENAVRQRARFATGVLSATSAPSPSAAVLRRALGDHALVEVIGDGDALHAAVVTQGGVRLRRLGDANLVAHELDRLGFALRRIAQARGSDTSRAAAVDAAAAGAERLDALLLAPVAMDIGCRPVVLVPTGGLHAVPWALLPTARGRPVTVAPSAPCGSGLRPSLGEAGARSGCRPRPGPRSGRGVRAGPQLPGRSAADWEPGHLPGGVRRARWRGPRPHRRPRLLPF